MENIYHYATAVFREPLESQTAQLRKLLASDRTSADQAALERIPAHKLGRGLLHGVGYTATNLVLERTGELLHDHGTLTATLAPVHRPDWPRLAIAWNASYDTARQIGFGLYPLVPDDMLNQAPDSPYFYEIARLALWDADWQEGGPRAAA